jgi:hypothetical protein
MQSIKWIKYDVYVDGEFKERTNSTSPKECLETFAWSEANYHEFYFHANKVEIVSSRKRHVFLDVEYFGDLISLYIEGKYAGQSKYVD